MRLSRAHANRRRWPALVLRLIDHGIGLTLRIGIATAL